MNRVWTSRAAKARTILVAACAVYAWSLLTALGVFGASAPQAQTNGAAASAYEYEYAAGHVTGGGQIPGDVTFSFNAKADASGLHAHCNVVDRSTMPHEHVKCLTLTMLVVTGTHATFTGEAEHDGVPTTYTINIDDFDESGRGADRFSISTTSGFARAGVLTAGNVQIHS